MEATHTLMGPYITITLDAGEVYPKDPGQGTPAVVTTRSGACATYECAVNTGLLMTDDLMREYPLTEAQLKWLDAQEEFIEEFVTYWTREKSK
jgi:hypothetical protein